MRVRVYVYLLFSNNSIVLQTHSLSLSFPSNYSPSFFLSIHQWYGCLSSLSPFLSHSLYIYMFMCVRVCLRLWVCVQARLCASVCSRTGVCLPVGFHMSQLSLSLSLSPRKQFVIILYFLASILISFHFSLMFISSPFFLDFLNLLTLSVFLSFTFSSFLSQVCLLLSRSFGAKWTSLSMKKCYFAYQVIEYSRLIIFKKYNFLFILLDRN